MDILKILTESARDLIPEDLDVLETELATGDFDDEYRAKCLARLSECRLWLSGEAQPEEDKKPAQNPDPRPQPKGGSGVKVSFSALAPTQPAAAAQATAEEMLLSEVQGLRKQPTYKTMFKKFAAETDALDASFIDVHPGFFQPWELDAIISVKQMPEAFLEKYFDALDHDKLARYQKFSEAFFMKHFADLSPMVVLQCGKNPWRKKSNRSKQLDIFLRAHGTPGHLNMCHGPSLFISEIGSLLYGGDPDLFAEILFYFFLAPIYAQGRFGAEGAFPSQAHAERIAVK